MEFITGSIFACCEVDWQYSWGDHFFQDLCGIFVCLPGVELKFEGIFIDDLFILICKPDGGNLWKAIVEASKEVGYAKGLGTIGNHDGCFAE